MEPPPKKERKHDSNSLGTLFILPNDILWLILSFLPVCDKVLLMQLNTYWRDIVGNDLRFWEILDLLPLQLYFMEDEQIPNYLLKRGSNLLGVRTLRIGGDEK